MYLNLDRWAPITGLQPPSPLSGCPSWKTAFDLSTDVGRDLYTDPSPTACGMPETYDASKEFAGKKVVIVSVPGAFTPGCQA